MTILWVTGCDARYFLTTLAFLQEIADRVPRSRVRVCDFGMPDGQRGFLRAAGLLLERPASVPAGSHPYLCKGSLSDYCRGETSSGLLWLDSDMLLGALDLAVVEGLEAELERGGAAFAATGTIDRASIARVMEELRASGHEIAPTLALLREGGVDVGRPYVSAGLMLWRSRELMARWGEACRASAPQALLEQNVLNALAMREPESVLVLDARRWQVYDAALARVTMPDPSDPHRLELDGQPVMTVHASSRRGHHLDADLSLNFGDHVLKGYLRTFVNPELQRRQLRNLAAAVEANRDALLSIGVLRPR